MGAEERRDDGGEAGNGQDRAGRTVYPDARSTAKPGRFWEAIVTRKSGTPSPIRASGLQGRS